MTVKLELDVGIISGDQKRALECYVDQSLFSQRKTYDEYYVDATSFDADVDINGLMILSQEFNVSASWDSIIIRDKD